ncbi:hypothetical protein Pcinc_009284 [Petrolisthes cinctipes]|nr:hypothetical protein Pcinc_009284 [Petrolisthes cinctipes]
MEYEKSIVSSKNKEGTKKTSRLMEGISYLLKELKGERPWEALWPSFHENNSGTSAASDYPVDAIDLDNGKEYLTPLLVEACQLGATLTASFLVWSGASYDSSCIRSGQTALHAAFDAGQLETASTLVRHLGANIYLHDSQGRLPLTLCPSEYAKTLQEHALDHDYRVLDFLVCKAKSVKEKERLIHMVLLLALLYTSNMLASKEVAYGEPKKNRKSNKPDHEMIMDHSKDLRHDKETVCDSWLRKLLPYLTKKRDSNNHDYKQDDEKQSEGKEDYQGKIGNDNDQNNDDDDNDEGLFVTLLEKLSQLALQENNITEMSLESNELLDTTLHTGFQVACENSLYTMIHLILTVGGVGINDVLEKVSRSTALHVAASHGHLGMCNFLMKHGASKSSLDRARRTPAHLAFMFGHSDAGDLLVTGVEAERDMANSCPRELLDSFKIYMKFYELDAKLRVKPQEENDANGLIRAHLRHFKQKWCGKIDMAVRALHVNFTKGEAKEIKEALATELKRLLEELGEKNPLFASNLHILGSSADNLRLFAPDEFDCNVVLKNISGFPDGGFHVTLEQLPDNIALAKGYTTSLCVTPAKEELEDLIDSEKFVNMFFEAVSACVTSFQPFDHRLSLVLPGIRKTQVGANVSFAWQGSEFPLLLIDVDIVPVANIPWPAELERPPMTPSTIDSVQIASMGDGNWRCSFAAVENLIFRELPDTKRMVLLACKLLIVSLRSESWATRDVKEQFTYWDGRRFKIPAPAGFILKSAFLKEMEEIQNDSLWESTRLMERMKSVFRRMCIVDDISVITESNNSGKANQSDIINTQPSENTKFFCGKVRAYFGGECEKASVGISAPEILRFLESW